LTPNKVRAEQLYAFLIEFRTLTINKITVSQDQLELAKDEFNINTESRDAIMAAQGMLEGVEKERFEQSMNIIHSNISQMVGEINYVMEMTQPILDAQRFEDGMALQNALANFEIWMSKDTAVSSSDKQQMMLKAASEDSIIETTKTGEVYEPQAVPVRRSKYDVGNR
jgi:hypothetical protein